MKLFLLLLLGWVFFCFWKAVCSAVCPICGRWGTVWKEDEHLWMCRHCNYEEDATIYQDVLSRASKKLFEK